MLTVPDTEHLIKTLIRKFTVNKPFIIHYIISWVLLSIINIDLPYDCTNNM